MYTHARCERGTTGGVNMTQIDTTHVFGREAGSDGRPRPFAPVESIAPLSL